METKEVAAMHIIGITGGVGAGKSEVLSYIREKYNCRIVLADEVGHLVKMPGQSCYEQLVKLLGKEILQSDGMIDKVKMAAVIFQDAEILKQVNALIHPAVEQYIFEEITKEKEQDILDFFFVEAALLLESKLHEQMETIWYIYADEKVRRERLKAAREYSDEKIDGILASQKTEEEFKKYCDVIIYNNGQIEETKKQIDEKLGAYLWQ